MTWREIKDAVSQAGVKDDEEIAVIQCENGRGDHTFHKVTLGKRLKLEKSIRRLGVERSSRVCNLKCILDI